MIQKIAARKLGMTTVFSEGGDRLAVTLLEPYDAVVTQVKTQAKEGYTAVQLAYFPTLPKRLPNGQKGVLKRAGVEGAFKYFYESRIPSDKVGDVKPGQVFKPQDVLANWGEVNVTGTSKGKGFAGVIKRHHMSGCRMTHGQTIHRKPASNNATDPARVFKGSRRPGHMGAESVTLKDVSVFEYDPNLNVLVLQGSVPSANGSILYVSILKEMESVG
jgi:large subunit ribosomal protein L3